MHGSVPAFTGLFRLVRFHVKNADAKVGVIEKTALPAGVTPLIPPVLED